MKSISKHNGKSVYSTNYKPLFGYKSLVAILEENGFNTEHGKSRNTNTYYIESWNNHETKCFEIRLSDHTKYQQNDSEKSYTNYYGGDTLEVNIIDSEGFKLGKAEILKFIKK